MGKSEKLVLKNLKQYCLLSFLILWIPMMIPKAACGAVMVSDESGEKRIGVSKWTFAPEAVLETAHFSEETRRTHQLLNPPKNLHPWLQWLLYSSRLNKHMVLNYYAMLKKRDQIYQRAVKSSGQLGIVYQGKVFRDIPPFVTPDWADGDYMLVKLQPGISSETNNFEINHAILPARESEPHET